VLAGRRSSKDGGRSLGAGVGSAVSSIGFGAILPFSAPISAEHGRIHYGLRSAPLRLPWSRRAFLGHSPGSLGGATVALQNHIRKIFPRKRIGAKIRRFSAV
jgi:hypothetical protein